MANALVIEANRVVQNEIMPTGSATGENMTAQEATSPTSRPSSLMVGERSLPLPVFFPSISSVKTALLPQEYLQLMSSLTGLTTQFLVSAFDLAGLPESIAALEALSAARSQGAIALMDSGNYESFWKDAQSVWTQELFHETLKKFPVDLAFSFDEQKPPKDKQEHVALVIDRWRNDQLAAGSCLIVPIVHAAADQLPEICAAVAKASGITIIAVAERRLGDGILQRFDTVKAIRAELNGLGRYIALHLLGTGNPISIAAYTAAGADSFDGLEWCQTVVDHDTGLLYHLSQSEFFAAQTSWAEAGLSFQARTLAHNLEFFAAWMSRLREASAHGHIAEFCRLHFPVRAYRHIAERAGWDIP